MSRDFDLARERLPLARVAEQNGASLTSCPVCRSAAAVVENGRFDDGWLAGLRASADLVLLVERMTGRPLSKDGAGFKAECPQCSGKLTVYRKNGMMLAKCWGQQGGCDVKGDAVAVMMKLGGLEFPEAVEELAKELGQKVQFAGAGRRSWLKCGKASCPAHEHPLDEVGLLAAVMGLDPAKKSDRGQASVTFLQQAGITRGERLAPSVMPGQSRRAGDWQVTDPEAVPQEAAFVEESGGSTPHPGPLPSSDEGRGGSSLDEAPETISVAEPAPAVPSPLPANHAGDPSPEVHSDPPGNPPSSTTETTGPVTAEGDGATLPAAEAEPAIAIEDDGPLVDTGDGSGLRAEVSSDEVRDVIRWFYSRLEWREAEGEDMEFSRGLEPATQRVLGYRSNQRSNRAILEEAAKKFGVGTCLAAGFWVRGGQDAEWASDAERSAGAKPSPYYHGLGRVGEREVERNGKTEKVPEFGWNEPPIIPYWDCVPELGGVAAPVAYKQAIVTEGEFKAGALWQWFAKDAWTRPTMPLEKLLLLRPHKHFTAGASGLAYLTPPGNGTLGVASMPGISFWRKAGGSWLCQHLFRLWLQRTGVRDLFVVYDNEDRTRKRESTRHDTVVSALLLGRDVARELGISVRYGQLPKWLRDASGKADWDAALAELRHYLAEAKDGKPPANPGDLLAWRKRRDTKADRPAPVAVPAPTVGPAVPDDDDFNWDECRPAHEQNP